MELTKRVVCLGKEPPEADRLDNVQVLMYKMAGELAVWTAECSAAIKPRNSAYSVAASDRFVAPIPVAHMTALFDLWRKEFGGVRSSGEQHVSVRHDHYPVLEMCCAQGSALLIQSTDPLCCAPSSALSIRLCSSAHIDAFIEESLKWLNEGNETVCMFY